MEKVSDRLREARERAGYATPDAFAEHAGLDPAVYRGYEDATRAVPPTTGYRIAEQLGVDWIRLLYGRQVLHASVDAGWQGGQIVPRALAPQTRDVAYAGAAPLPPAPELLPEASAADVVAGLAKPFVIQPATARAAEPERSRPAAPPPPREKPVTVTVPELDPALASGSGIARASEAPVREWQLPSDVVRAARSGAAGLKMISVVTDDMAPALEPGDRVLVDTAETDASTPGVFLIWDGMALILRHVEIVPGSEPVMLRLATNNPKIAPVERRLAETVIQGRVIGKWSAV